MRMDIAAVLLLLILTVVIFTFLRKREPQQESPEDANQLQTLEPQNGSVPSRIVIGESPSQPLVTIETLQSDSGYETAKPLDISRGPISRLSAMLQAVPSVLVAAEASGKQLMEVVVNGDLVRAADGNGLRAFTMGADGIRQHARLFEVSNLQNMINATAIWQVASVVVAQKHLADISQKLDEIKMDVQGISRFLDNQRKSRIQATYDYLGQAYQAIQSGELPSSVRNQLENCERDLLEIHLHLEKEYRQKVDEKVKHKEVVGTEDLTSDIGEKIDRLDAVAHDMALCVKTRIAAWHVLSLYPGEPQLKLARRKSIQESIDTIQSLGPYFAEAIEREIGSVKSVWNRTSTLKERRDALGEKRVLAVRSLGQKSQQGREALEHSEQLMLAHDHPTRVLLQFDNGKLIAAMSRS